MAVVSEYCWEKQRESLTTSRDRKRSACDFGPGGSTLLAQQNLSLGNLVTLGHQLAMGASLQWIIKIFSWPCVIQKKKPFVLLAYNGIDELCVVCVASLRHTCSRWMGMLGEIHVNGRLRRLCALSKTSKIFRCYYGKFFYPKGTMNKETIHKTKRTVSKHWSRKICMQQYCKENDLLSASLKCIQKLDGLIWLEEHMNKWCQYRKYTFRRHFFTYLLPVSLDFSKVGKWRIAGWYCFQQEDAEIRIILKDWMYKNPISYLCWIPPF